MPSHTSDKKEPGALRRTGEQALAAVSESTRTKGVPAAIALGLLPVYPLSRRNQLPKTFPEGFSTKTPDETVDLVSRLVAKAGRTDDPNLFMDPETLAQATPHAGFGQKFTLGKPTKEYVRVSTGLSPETVAHETGHMHTPTKVEEILKRISPFLRHPAGIAAPAAIALTGALNKEKNNPVARAAPYIGALQLAAILAEEGRANVRGAGLLSGVGKAMSTSDKLKMFLPTLTYLGLAVPLIGAPIGILKGLDKYREAKAKGLDINAKNMFFHSPSDIAKLPTPEELKSNWRQRLGISK
jgi:hypothetical protein